MANRTDAAALQVHGTDPQFLIEKILRERIHSSIYWKAQCFGLNAETILDEVVKLKCIGGMIGVGGEGMPSNFLCLLLKLLQIQPQKEIILEYIQQSEFKLLRLLAALYLRLTGTSLDIYSYLEPLYYDCRAVYFQLSNGKFQRVFMDECVHEMLKREKFCDVSLPKIAKREVLEEKGKLPPRESVLVQMVEVEAEAHVDSAEEVQSLKQMEAAGSGDENAGDNAKNDVENGDRMEEDAPAASGEGEESEVQRMAGTAAAVEESDNAEGAEVKNGRRREERRTRKRSRSRSRSGSRGESHSRSRSRDSHRRRRYRSRSRSRSRSRDDSHSPDRNGRHEKDKDTNSHEQKERKEEISSGRDERRERKHSHHHRRRNRGRSRSRSSSGTRSRSRSHGRNHSHRSDTDRKPQRDSQQYSLSGDAPRENSRRGEQRQSE